MVALACSDPMTDPRANGIPTAMACSGRQLSLRRERRLQARAVDKSTVPVCTAPDWAKNLTSKQSKDPAHLRPSYLVY